MSLSILDRSARKPAAASMLALQLQVANQRRAVRELFDACCAQGHPEFFGQVAYEPLIEINVLRVQLAELQRAAAYADPHDAFRQAQYRWH